MTSLDFNEAVDLTRLHEIKETDRIARLLNELLLRIDRLERTMLTVNDLGQFKSQMLVDFADDLRPAILRIMDEGLTERIHTMKEALAEELCGVIDERMDEL